MEEYQQARNAFKNRQRIIKTVEDLRRLMIEIEMSKLNIRITDNFNRTKANMVLRNYRRGFISFNDEPSELIDKINNLYNLNLTLQAYHDAGKLDRMNTCILPGLLKEDIEALSGTILINKGGK